MQLSIKNNVPNLTLKIIPKWYPWAPRGHLGASRGPVGAEKRLRIINAQNRRPFGGVIFFLFFFEADFGPPGGPPGGGIFSKNRRKNDFWTKKVDFAKMKKRFLPLPRFYWNFDSFFHRFFMFFWVVFLTKFVKNSKIKKWLSIRKLRYNLKVGQTEKSIGNDKK